MNKPNKITVNSNQAFPTGKWHWNCTGTGSELRFPLDLHCFLFTLSMLLWLHFQLVNFSNLSYTATPATLGALLCGGVNCDIWRKGGTAVCVCVSS